MIDENKLGLEELKEIYKTVQEKYNLPEFFLINKSFDIEDVDYNTDFLLRKIRRAMLEKLSTHLRFVEILMNPSNGPVIFFKLLRKLDSVDKEKLAKIYEIVTRLELESLRLDLDYDEDSEAKFINKLYNTFNDDIKHELGDIFSKLENGESERKESNGSYFG